MIPTQRANKGRGLELAVKVSQIGPGGRILTLDKQGQQVRFVRGGDTKLINSPPDFTGTVFGRGLHICFDCKECADAKGFPIRAWVRARPHQREYLLRHGEAGAVAGLLVESKALLAFLWLDWSYIRAAGDTMPTVPWGTGEEGLMIHGWDYLGDSRHAIKFDRIPGVRSET